MKVRWVAGIRTIRPRPCYYSITGLRNGDGWPAYALRVQSDTRARLFDTKEEAEAEASRFARLSGLRSYEPWVRARRIQTPRVIIDTETQVPVGEHTWRMGNITFDENGLMRMRWR